MSEYLFVYGTLRRAAGHPMARLLAVHGEFAGAARYAGRLFDLGPYPAAVPAADAGRGVVGDLYRLSAPRNLLRLLDRYEGCTDSRDPANAYRRERVPVTGPDGTPREAWIYLYNRPTHGLPLIASGDYLRRQHRPPLQSR